MDTNGQDLRVCCSNLVDALLFCHTASIIYIDHWEHLRVKAAEVSWHCPVARLGYLATSGKMHIPQRALGGAGTWTEVVTRSFGSHLPSEGVGLPVFGAF